MFRSGLEKVKGIGFFRWISICKKFWDGWIYLVSSGDRVGLLVWDSDNSRM